MISLSSKKKYEQGFESHPKTPQQYLHIAFTAMVSVHIGKNTE
jgi:hypothetical protein